ncbi:ribonuclease Z [Sinomicrobium soli]|uniref:ribonuclease Z n=1 Tax=Sinomicrobium sp. N-1-3-6 TaxID=2219864 RepID=UPI000DCCD288|nr:ribonuclease Z [Sinomicrobium sp. N-1-3-6]RAV28606.1 ribonuclease Z [Sinomicrobium sp. N-1-3-6]
MIFDKQNNNTTIVTHEKGGVNDFCLRLEEVYDKLASDHLVVNLFSLDRLEAADLGALTGISARHRGNNKSFVIVTNKISPDEVPGELVVVPTLQEARDIIEMDEIERDLGL